MPRVSKADGRPLRADVPVWVLSWPGHFTLVAAADKTQARLLGLGWALERTGQNARYSLKVRRAREADMERVRDWAGRGDDMAAAILAGIGCRPRPEEDTDPQPPVEDQLAMPV